MLAVLMKILSIIGIVLLCLLGLFLISLLLVLFWPVTYRIDAHRDDSGTGLALNARWLLGLVRISYLYPNPGRLKAKLLFFTIYDSGREKKLKGAKDKESESTDRNRQSRQDPKRQSGETDWKYESLTETNNQNDPLKAETEEPESAKTIEGTNGQQQTENVENSLQEENIGTSNRILDILSVKIKKIKYTIDKIYDKIKHILENFSYYRKLLREEETKLLFGQVWARMFKILRSLRPRKLTANIRFGTGSPDTTGYMLGLYCMLSPFWGQNINIVPDFEETVLTGELHAAGRITAFVLLFHGVGMLLDKNLRKFIRKMKREDA